MKKLLLLLFLFLAVPVHAGFLLQWQDNSDNEQGFIIQRKLQGANYAEIGRVGVNIVSFPDQVVGAQPGQIYCYLVYAYNKSASGQEQTSPPTNEACGTVPASGVTIPQLSAQATSPNSVKLDWTAVTDPTVIRLEVRRRISNTTPDYGTIVTALTPPFPVTYTDTSCNPNTSYDYRINVYSSAGFLGASNALTIVTPQSGQVIPVPPGATGLMLQWQ